MGLDYTLLRVPVGLAVSEAVFSQSVIQTGTRGGDLVCRWTVWMPLR